MNSKGAPVHVVAWRVDALVVEVWERVWVSNPRWCRPFLYLLILRDILALLAGFPLGWLASESSVLIPESQRLPPSCRGRRGNRSIPRSERGETQEGASSRQGLVLSPPSLRRAMQLA